ncbi:Polysaccharide deacetylase [Candidatus Contendobacter odensis Run_B_J11]|uniref:Polysaccharide deacetylase n=1 Tax=Candidatus Contendobacter odensis Run_B_J11 TaxID=1400861 RepID=A0A7U7GAI8_9GAMM|nr:polysaccharide deacetylase family protein [Candidatus Competibacteraceae bacterium]CDH44536.1 Polysaccharide deacetylase [Candidatus Contendobacter odensis Run_B_J11]
MVNGDHIRVIQSWDDGVVDDIRLTELLRHYQATATFNLNPGLHQRQRSFSWCYGDKEVWRLGVDEWVEVYAGFEIANHSLNHPYLPDLSLTDLEREVRDSRHMLQDWFQQPVRGFCYPFGGVNPAVKVAVRSAGHVYARTVNEHESVFPPADPFEFGVSCRFADSAFWNHYERAKTDKGVFCFWGHSYELTSEAMWADLEDKIARITADRAAEWVNIEPLIESDQKPVEVLKS